MTATTSKFIVDFGIMLRYEQQVTKRCRKTKNYFNSLPITQNYLGPKEKIQLALIFGAADFRLDLFCIMLLHIVLSQIIYTQHKTSLSND